MGSLEKILGIALSSLIITSPRIVLSDEIPDSSQIEIYDEEPRLNKLEIDTTSYKSLISGLFDYNSDDKDDIFLGYKDNSLYVRWNNLTKNIENKKIDYNKFKGYGIINILNPKSPENLENYTYYSMVVYGPLRKKLDSDVVLLEIDNADRKMAFLIPKDKEELNIRDKLNFNFRTKTFTYTGDNPLILSIENSRQEKFENMIRTYPLEFEQRLKELQKDEHLRENADSVSAELELKLEVETDYEREVIKAIKKSIMLDYLSTENNAAAFITNFEYNGKPIELNEALIPPKDEEKPFYKRTGFIIGSSLTAVAISAAAYFLLKPEVKDTNETPLPQINPEGGFYDLNGK